MIPYAGADAHERHPRYVVYRKRHLRLRDAVELAGNVVKPDIAWSRIKTYGWNVNDALETPNTRAIRPTSFSHSAPFAIAQNVRKARAEDAYRKDET